MRDPYAFISGLLDLPTIEDPAERRAVFRQSMATLARVGAEGPRPLEGLHPEGLIRGVKTALGAGMIDDLDFLAPGPAGAALFELAAALPVGAEQRELGRRVLERLLAANAEAFAVIATRMALAASKALAGPAVRARVALVVEMPLTWGVNDGALALAIASRRELAREWIVSASTRSLSSRRLASRLLERAAREASRRAAQGDVHAVRLLATGATHEAYRRLLDDREPLVWRHVAVARGLLAPWWPDAERELAGVFDPELSPTEWRRGATSWTAAAAVMPDQAVPAIERALQEGLLSRDAGAAAAIVWGLARAAEAEPEAAEKIASALSARANLTLAEPLLDLHDELGGSPLLEGLARKVLPALEAGPSDPTDDGAEALYGELARDLAWLAEHAGPDHRPYRPRVESEPLRRQLRRALQAFCDDGAKAAYASAGQLLVRAEQAVTQLEMVTPEDEARDDELGQQARRTSLGALRDLDGALLERSGLPELLALATPSESARGQEAVSALDDRLASFILARESEAETGGLPRHPTLRLRRLRALLHLADGGTVSVDDARARTRRLLIAARLVLRSERERPSILRRTVIAALARALDALVRMEACEGADAFLVLARTARDPQELAVLAEASMDPDLDAVLDAYVALVRTVASADAAESARAVDDFAATLPADAGGRMGTLRTILTRLGSALGALTAASSLRALAGDDNEVPSIDQLESWLVGLTQLVSGARSRLLPEETQPRASSLPPPGHLLGHALSRALSGTDLGLDADAVQAAVTELTRGVPAGVAAAVTTVVHHLLVLPVDRPSAPQRAPEPQAEPQLPEWLPARRTIGGFYVLRPLSSGALGTVFVVQRIEDRHDPAAERLALKVPDYSASAARALSETEFLQMFRQEASALLDIPQHPNLARFVTFDAGARPKPVLVMELVEGMTLERLIDGGAAGHIGRAVAGGGTDVSLTSRETVRCLRILDGILAGLEAMHGVGVGHLDLKPSNVVLRQGDEPVLVDFGLAGRRLRPGCATGPYGAPEVWGAIVDGMVPDPMMADIYAFGCVAYETLTGETLFDAPTELAQVALHVGHDGDPPGITRLAMHAGTRALANWIGSALRRDGRQRASATELRHALRSFAPEAAGESAA